MNCAKNLQKQLCGGSLKLLPFNYFYMPYILSVLELAVQTSPLLLHEYILCVCL